MKRVIFTIVLLVSSNCWALTYMGPTVSDISSSEFGIGFDYATGQADIGLDGYGYSWTADMELDAYFAKLLFGLGDNAEFSVRLGLGQIEEDYDYGDNFSSSNDFIWGLGFKSKIGGDGDLKWGALFQLAAITGDDYAYVGPYLVEADIDVYEIQVAIGPTFEKDNFCIYGGPFFHFITGELEGRALGYSISVDIEQESEIGGYIGMAAKLTDTSSLNFEYQSTGDASAFGISFVHRFGEKTIAAERKPVPKIRADESGRKVQGYKGTINPQTGKSETTPIFEEK